MTRLLDAYQEELLSLEDLRPRMTELSKRAKAAELELGVLEASAEDEQRYLKIAESVEGFLGRLQTTADTLGIEERQKVLRLLVKEILVDHETITIRHSIPVTDRGTPPPSSSETTKSSSYQLRSGRRFTDLG